MSCFLQLVCYIAILHTEFLLTSILQRKLLHGNGYWNDEIQQRREVMSYQDKKTDEILMLPVKSIYVGYRRFVGHNSKHILGHEYKWYSVYSSSIAKISQNQDEYTNWPYDHVHL